MVYGIYLITFSLKYKYRKVEEEIEEEETRK